MARPSKHPLFKLPDGRETPGTLQLRGTVYRVRFKSPEGKFVVATTGRTDIAGAWTEAAKVILAAFTPSQKVDLRKGTWDQALAELPKSRSGKELRPRSLEAYTSRINVFRVLTPGSKGPHDVTPAVAQEFADKYAGTKFTKSKKPGAKEYTRSLETVATTVRVLSGLWSHLRKMKVVTSNPWEDVQTPDPPKFAPTAPTEKDTDQFFQWLDAKKWELLSVFFRIKAFIGCRTDDLCQALSSQFDPKTGTLVINPAHEKTNQERRVPLPPDMAKRLEAVAGDFYLWERYAAESKIHRPGRRNQTVFKPSLMYWFIDDVCPQYRKANPNAYPITPHDLRRRAITLAVIAAGGNVDEASQALRIHPDTARENYIDMKQAVDTDALFKRLAATAK